MKQRISALLALLVVVILAFPPIAYGQSPREYYGWVIADTVTVRNLLAVQAGGITVTDGGVTITDDGLTVTDDGITVTDDNLTLVDGFLDMGNASVITLTMNATLTPNASYQPLASSGTVNTSSITVGSAGTLLTLVNTTNTSIVFTDTGTLKLSGNLTLGQNDSVTLVSDGTNWNQLATSNN